MISIFQTHFGTDEEAYESVRRGKAWGALIFASNYSESLVDRTEYGQNVPNSVLDAAELNVKLDMSSKFHFLLRLSKFLMHNFFPDQQIGTLLYRDIQYAFFDFIESILKDCQYNPSVGKIPITWQDPIYGDRIPNFTDFAAPGVQLT